jgi:S-adenosylmethionine/arginine decarboxylase-like enzyme
MAEEHKHLIIRAEVKKPPIDPIWATNWLTHVVQKIGMKILMGPYATYCPVPGNAGLTAAVIIETSHIVLHIFDEKNPAELQLDVYTCSKLNISDIFEELVQFEPVKIEYKYLDREYGLKEIEFGVF